jgi:hypothetical protein
LVVEAGNRSGGYRLSRLSRSESAVKRINEDGVLRVADLENVRFSNFAFLED